MEVLDNRAHILRRIKQQADREVKKLEQQHADELRVFKNRLDAKTTAQLESLRDNWKHTRVRLKRQNESANDLRKTQATLEKHSVLFKDVKTQLLEILKGKELDTIVQAMIERLKKSGKSFLSVKIPKKCTLEGQESFLSNGKATMIRLNPVLDALEVVGVVSENEEVEIQLDDLLHEHHSVIHGIIQEELF